MPKEMNEQTQQTPAAQIDESRPSLDELLAQDEKLPTKKEQILQLYQDGIVDVAELAYLVDAQSSYVANVLSNAGLLKGYFDLYTSTANEQNVYSRYFRNVLAFKDTEAARQSVEKIDRIYKHFERLGDRAGQHHAMVLALTGMNRARWGGKLEEAQIFHDWLVAH